ncbi:type I restriction-modification system subunit M N-terminal domain-containing protein [Neolewinella sp.]|uniref:type I restriction-modification system subunit M N-terminal domain-containing protein n=1 Tax=Neolewinella sp. TaxID=2993543 RepID=UPI003B526B7C
MTHDQIRNLESDLWGAADDLRSNSKLTAAEYKDPLLGLVLLRFAQNRYEDAAAELAGSLPVNPRTGQRREAWPDDFARRQNEGLREARDLLLPRLMGGVVEA